MIYELIFWTVQIAFTLGVIYVNKNKYKLLYRYYNPEKHNPAIVRLMKKTMFGSEATIGTLVVGGTVLMMGWGAIGLFGGFALGMMLSFGKADTAIGGAFLSIILGIANFVNAKSLLATVSRDLNDSLNPKKNDDKVLGASTWNSVEELDAECGLTKDQNGEWTFPTYTGIHIGAGFHWFKRDLNILTVGNPGTGKNTSLVYPALLSDYLGGASLIVNDPKGQNAAIAGRFLETQGYHIHLLKFDEYRSLPQGSGFNPLLMLDINRPDFQKLTEIIAESLTPNTGGKDEHWDTMAREWLQTLTMHLCSYYAPHERTFATLLDWLSTEKGLLAVLLEAQSNDLLGGKIARRASGMVEKISRLADDGEARSILSNTRKALRGFDDHFIQQVFSGSDFSWLDLTEKPVAVFVCLPADSGENHFRALRLLTLTAFHALRRRADKSRKVLVLLDEFAQMGKLNSFPKDIAEIRDYNVSLWMVIQNLAQLKNLYGENWKTIFDACQVKQFMPNTGYDTAKIVSEMLGNRTVTYETESTGAEGHTSRSEHKTARPLLSPDEVMATTGIIAFIGKGKHKLKLMPYYDDEKLKQKAGSWNTVNQASKSYETTNQ